MPMTIYKLYGGSSGDDAASLDIQIDGEIEAILMSADVAGADALNDGVIAEVSFLSTNGFGSNDVRGSLMTVQCRQNFLTSGGGNMATNMAVGGISIPVAAGERVHLHILDRGSPTSRSVHAYLYVRDKGTARVLTRRR